jgi:hypothetical protein
LYLQKRSTVLGEEALLKKEIVFRNETVLREDAVIKEVVDAKKRQILAKRPFFYERV